MIGYDKASKIAHYALDNDLTLKESFFHDERRNFVGQIDCISEAALGFEVIKREKEGRYSIHKTILGLACDHGGFSLKQDLLERLSEAGPAPIDFGAHAVEPKPRPDGISCRFCLKPSSNNWRDRIVLEDGR